jgi:beta-galactosidase
VSGKVDAVRLPKEIYFTHRVMQNDKPDMHILGHWSYPAGTTRTVYVVANHVQSVELSINGKSAGVNSTPENGYVYAFPNIEFAPGTLKAIAKNDGKPVLEQELVTAGPPAQIKLTPITGPKGLRADGADVALIDVEVLDAKGERVPTDDARIDFKCDGPGVWRGGYNSGKTDSTNNLYLNTELGINRVAVRSTPTAGTITVTASREGLKSAQVKIVSR